LSKLKQLYKEIWQERPHRCEVCGYPISKPIAHVFAHIKSKGAHPSLKYAKSNIRLLCSTIIRSDNKRGCHELEHTNPEKFKERLHDF
jgi:5-methylcytosine-specific restriction endonuclease McrA